MKENGGNLQEKDSSCANPIFPDEASVHVLSGIDDLSHLKFMSLYSEFE